MNRKKFYLRKNLFAFIIAVFLFGSISVFAVTYFPSSSSTYDPSVSGLNSTNVQDALDELYNVCQTITSEDLIDGLEKDPYECRYFFTGANPNNYITFNEEKAGWRIISVECDGTIKIMRRESIITRTWGVDSVFANSNWADSPLQTYLNETYYKQIVYSSRKYIESSQFSIGAIQQNNNLQNQITNENKTTWNGYIALPTLSEYIRVSANNSLCGSIELYNNNREKCNQTNWMKPKKVDYWYTLTPDRDLNNTEVYMIHNEYIDTISVRWAESAYPVLYLSSDLKLSGTGTQSDPYTIK